MVNAELRDKMWFCIRALLLEAVVEKIAREKGDVALDYLGKAEKAIKEARGESE